MIRSLILPGIFGISLLASCGPPYPDDGPWGPPPPAWRGPYGGPPVYGEPPAGRGAAGSDPRRQDPYRQGPPQRDYDRWDDGGSGPTRPPPTQNPPPTRDSYPVAERTENPDRVISPFPPYNVIDVAGFSSGQLARDPSNQRIFRVP